MNPAMILSALIAMCVALFTNQKTQQFFPRDGNSPAGSGAFFDTIAGRYDLLNRIISLGLDAQWRRDAIDEALPAKSVLDVSTGTADIAMEVAKDSSIRVVGLDPSGEMLALGRKKVDRAGLRNVKLVQGVAERLPFESGSFDAVVVAFGVRNFQNREKGLAEMVRVLRKGGRLVVLELSMPGGDGLGSMVARVLIREVMPKVAGIVAGNSAAYRYLSDSMTSFPDAETFRSMLRDVGLRVKSHKKLSPYGFGPDLFIAEKR